MDIDYIKPKRAFLYRWETDPVDKKSKAWRERIKTELLWGDRVFILTKGTGKRHKVRARGQVGWIDKSKLGGKSLLEFYFIDVGQGDGVLIRTPEDKHLLIDGGWPRSDQPLGKNAGDFVDWKFKRDYREKTIRLDAMICSHNDQDHYGGLWDLLNPKQKTELGVKAVSVENFYHTGLSWWKKGKGRTLGKTVTTSDGKMFITFIDDRESVRTAIKDNAKPALQGEWRKFLECVLNSKTKDGKSTPMKRLCSKIEYLPGFEPSSGKVSIKVLGPVAFQVNGKPAIRWFPDGDSKNTNGNSVLLRVDYINARVLLTGDLNYHSQTSLLKDYKGKHGEFSCDVAKACHHGSDDVSYEFLEKMCPTATIISSGDSEGHDHPRPNIVAASGLTGFKTIEDGKLKTPLVYSTELARSVKFGEVSKLEELDAKKHVLKKHFGKKLHNLRITFKGARRKSDMRIDERKFATGVVYGLINVRTDGKKILCAALNEKDSKWNIQTFKARTNVYCIRTRNRIKS